MRLLLVCACSRRDSGLEVLQHWTSDLTLAVRGVCSGRSAACHAAALNRSALRLFGFTQYALSLQKRASSRIRRHWPLQM